MASVKGQSVLRASVLDRLSREHHGRGTDGEIGLREVHDSVARDLERLLNTRIWWPAGLGAFDEASESVLTYGIPDLTNCSWASVKGENRTVARLVEDAIKRFEPRLLPRSVKVTQLEGSGDLRVRLRIDAILQVEPYTERISFDTDLDVATGAVQLRGDL
jgi:type VI secretion system protein ImpF